MTSEAELIRTLALRGHLSVADRQLLPDGRARVSVLRAEIAALIERAGRFPTNRRHSDGFDGALLERTGPECFRLLRKAETSLMRFETVDSADFTSLTAAVNAFIRANWPGHIDGVPIDWYG